MKILTTEHATLLVGDNRKTMPTLPNGSVHTVITSPPYFGLRDYGTAEWEGGDSECDHKPDAKPRASRPNPYGIGGIGARRVDAGNPVYKHKCKKCGAKRIDSQIGLEDSPDAYVREQVRVYREVYRVLRDDGTFWLNVGDSYAGNVGKGASGSGKNAAYLGSRAATKQTRSRSDGTVPTGNTVGIPWRVALALQGFAVTPFYSFSVWADELKMARKARDWEAVKIVEDKLRCMDLLAALQADGWILRNDIIWHRTNAMPESVRNRCSRNHEYVFLFVKKAKGYFCDMEAIKERSKSAGVVPGGKKYIEDSAISSIGGKHTKATLNDAPVPEFSNKRTVWSVPVGGLREEHFAAYPEKLIRPCILAGTSQKGCCPKCGAPWRRLIEKIRKATRPGITSKVHGKESMTTGNRDPERHVTETRTVGWEPGCECGEKPVPCTVFDPFAGSGTTLLTAIDRGRLAIGCELNPKYAKIIMRRLRKAEQLRGFGF